MASVQVQRSESRDEAICRLASQAAERGVQVFRAPDGRYYASSLSQPGTLHYVTGHSCDCAGFIRHQRCSHHAALLAHMGWLPASPTPPAPAVARVPEVPCDRCDGHDWGYGGGAAVWTCAACHGTGVEPSTYLAA